MFFSFFEEHTLIYRKKKPGR